MHPIGESNAQRTGRTTRQERTAETPVLGGVRWLGMSEDAAAADSTRDRPTDGRGVVHVLGSAHGPRLLELIRAAC